MAEYKNKDVLIDAEELQENLDDPNLKIVEVDEDTSLYDKGHIPGAISWDWSKDLHDPLKRDFINGKQLVDLLTRSGIGADDTVVLYAGNNNWFAAYAYWLLKYRGFDNVKLLNGGRKKWELDSRDLTSEVPETPAPSQPVQLAGDRPEFRAMREEVLAAATSGGTFVDVRSPQEFRGELLAPPHLPQEQAQVPGHIPGAANITWSKAAAEDGTFLPAGDLEELYSGEGVTPDKDVIAYCRIGERSSHTWFVLKELLGYEKVKNYDGSWTEYGSLVGVPVER
ncbi:MAG TPA: sulfurtransferase [Actinomycetota bacterium]|jgi:thiosulfate/3-mercaptopyruvate sulfurtransferase|nr:sulfurtransferase [Actinomycetota bacterium]